MPEAALETKLLDGASTTAQGTLRLNARQAVWSEATLEDRAELDTQRFDERSVSNARVLRSNRVHSSLTMFCALIALTAITTACSGPPVSQGPLFGTGVFHPPPKPGDSISQTRMCECKACEPSNCCDGPEDDAPPVSCGDSYDFTANEACGGLSVKSCASRCTRQIWRVHAGEECSSKRPQGCCEAG